MLWSIIKKITGVSHQPDVTARRLRTELEKKLKEEPNFLGRLEAAFQRSSAIDVHLKGRIPALTIKYPCHASLMELFVRVVASSEMGSESVDSFGILCSETTGVNVCQTSCLSDKCENHGGVPIPVFAHIFYIDLYSENRVAEFVETDSSLRERALYTGSNPSDLPTAGQLERRSRRAHVVRKKAQTHRGVGHYVVVWNEGKDLFIADSLCQPEGWFTGDLASRIRSIFRHVFEKYGNSVRIYRCSVQQQKGNNNCGPMACGMLGELCMNNADDNAAFTGDQFVMIATAEAATFVAEGYIRNWIVKCLRLGRLRRLERYAPCALSRDRCPRRLEMVLSYDKFGGEPHDAQMDQTYWENILPLDKSVVDINTVSELVDGEMDLSEIDFEALNLDYGDLGGGQWEQMPGKGTFDGHIQEGGMEYDSRGKGGGTWGGGSMACGSSGGKGFSQGSGEWSGKGEEGYLTDEEEDDLSVIIRDPDVCMDSADIFGFGDIPGLFAGPDMFSGEESDEEAAIRWEKQRQEREDARWEVTRQEFKKIAISLPELAKDIATARPDLMNSPPGRKRDNSGCESGDVPKKRPKKQVLEFMGENAAPRDIQQVGSWGEDSDLSTSEDEERNMKP